MNQIIQKCSLWISVLSLALLMISCSSEDDKIEENPIFTLLGIPGTKVDTIEKAAKVWEYGFRFSPLKHGIITKFGIKIPQVGSYKVRFYSLNPDTLLQELIITSNLKHEESYVSIPELHLDKGGDYGISLIADAFFKVKNPDSTNLVFPRTVGNINIISFNESACGLAGCGDFPDNTNSLVIAPCVTLVYIGDE